MIAQLKQTKRYLERLYRERIVARHLASTGGGFVYRTTPVRIPDGLRLGIKAQIADGSYEASEAELVDRYLDPKLPVIELGGCLGLLSGQIAQKLAPGVPLVVVEANPELVEVCADNASLGGKCRDVRVINRAVAHGAKRIALAIGDNVHITRVGGDAVDGARTVDVDTVTLRELYAEIGEPPAFTLVCDIEGAELEVLRRERDVLARCRLVVMELHPHLYAANGGSEAEIMALAAEAGLEPIARIAHVQAFRAKNAAEPPGAPA